MPGSLSCDPLPLVPDSRGPSSHTKKRWVGTRPVSFSLDSSYSYSSTVAHPPRSFLFLFPLAFFHFAKPFSRLDSISISIIPERRR
ncbi:hypothetical protein V8C40DRAFT_79559 [Trichoderma camerunense]